MLWASRVVIEQAKGMLAERAGIEITEAFYLLQNYARSHSLLLAEVARAAVDGTLDPEAWGSPTSITLSTAEPD